MNNPNPKLRNALGISALTAFSLVMIGCGGSSSSAPVVTNQSPSAPGITATGLQITGHPMTFNLSAVDPEGDPITFTVSGAATASVGPTSGSGSFTFTPAVQTTPSSQSLSLSVIAKDSKGASSAATPFPWTEAPNHGPQFFSLDTPPIFAGVSPAIAVSFTVVSQDQDTDDVRFDPLTVVSMIDNNGSPYTGAAPSIDTTTGVITWSGSVPASAVSVTAKVDVKAKDFLPGTTTAVGGSSVQHLTLTYNSGNVPPVILTSSLPSLPANHYIPTKQGDPGMQLQATDANLGDTLTWRIVSPAGFALTPGANQYSKYLVSTTGFVPQAAGGSYTVVIGVSDGHNPEVQKPLTISVVSDSIPGISSTPYTEAVSGVNFFNTAKVKWDVTVPGTESPALPTAIVDPITARQRFYPGGVSWVSQLPYKVSYSLGESFAGATAAETANYDNAFSNYAGVYPAGFLSTLSDLSKSASGWNARTLFNDAEGDKVLYRMQGGSVFVAGTILTTVGQTFTLTGVDGATSTTLPLLGVQARTDEYPYVDASLGTIKWRPILTEIISSLGVDAWGNAIWSTPANWSFTVEALEKVYNPLGTGNAPGDINFDLIPTQKGIQNYTVKVQPNNRPVVGPLVTIPGGLTAVPGALANMVFDPSTTLVVGGGASIDPLAYGRPSIQEPESRRYDIGAGTGFDYTQKNTALPAVWRWLMAMPGGDNSGPYAPDVQIYDPDRTTQSGHQDTIVASMNPLLNSGIPGDPLPGDTSNNVPKLDANSKYLLNPWITAGNAGAFQVNWGPNRNQYLLARVAGTMNLTLPVDVRDQYQRQATASARINPIFGTVRITNDRQRQLGDAAAEVDGWYGNLEQFNNPLTLTNDGVGHYGDRTVGGGGTSSAAVFSYLPFPSGGRNGAVDETNYGPTATTATHLMDGTAPASGVIGVGVNALYTAASWITLYSTEAPQIGFHTGNPLNNETSKFNFTSYASALDGNYPSGISDWKTFGYTFTNGSNPTNPVEEKHHAAGFLADHEYRAQVIPSNSPWLFGQTSEQRAPRRQAQPLGWTGNTLQSPRRFDWPWHDLNYINSYGPNGYIYGLYQGEIDAQTALPGRDNFNSRNANTTLRWAYSWPTSITNPNQANTTGSGTNKWQKGDVMEIAVPNMGVNSRFFFTGDGSQNDSNAGQIEGWGWIGMNSYAGTVLDNFALGGVLGGAGAASNTTNTGFIVADNTPFHVPSNSIWVSNNLQGSGNFITQHLNLPNRTLFSPGASATELSFQGIRGYMPLSLAQNALVDPSYYYRRSSTSGFNNSYPGLIDLAQSDNIYYFWMRQEAPGSTAWGTWDASKIVPGSTYTATGGLTTVPNFTMNNAVTTSTYPTLFSGAQVSLSGGALPGQNHMWNVDVKADPALISGIWARSQWGLMAPTVGYQPQGISTNNVRLVNPKFNSIGGTNPFTNLFVDFHSLVPTTVSGDGGFRDSATVYAIQRHTDENGNANAELGLAGIEPGSPMLAQWYNLDSDMGGLPLDQSTVASVALPDVTAATWPKVFKFYSPFVGDANWANVMEFKMNFLVGVTYPNAGPLSLVKVPAVVANVFPMGAEVTDTTCTNNPHVVVVNGVSVTVGTINPGNPIVRSVQTLQINDYKANNTSVSRVKSTIDLANSNPTDPVLGGPNVIKTAGSNAYIQALSNVTLRWQSSVNNQVLPSGYFVELFRLVTNAGTDVNTPILLATFRTGHIGGQDAVQTMHLPSMHSFSGLTGVAGVTTEAVYFFKVRTLWYGDSITSQRIRMEKTPLKQSIPMAYADYVSSPFVTQ